MPETTTMTEVEVETLAPVGSRWLWLTSGQVEIIGYAVVDGEAAVRERHVKTGRKIVPTAASHFFKHATPVAA